jgi:hypothetical protein
LPPKNNPKKTMEITPPIPNPGVNISITIPTNPNVKNNVLINGLEIIEASLSLNPSLTFVEYPSP